MRFRWATNFSLLFFNQKRKLMKLLIKCYSSRNSGSNLKRKTKECLTSRVNEGGELMIIFGALFGMGRLGESGALLGCVRAKSQRPTLYPPLANWLGLDYKALLRVKSFKVQKLKYPNNSKGEFYYYWCTLFFHVGIIPTH